MSPDKNNPKTLPPETNFATDDCVADVAAQVASDSLQNELEKVRAELKDSQDRVLRSQAELENFRKRSRRELEDERRYAALPVMRDVLSVLDNLDRAIEAAEKNQGASGLLEGVKMVAAQVTTLLEQHQCKRIAAAGAPFDPNFHAAIAQEPSETVPAGVITRVAVHGYQLHDRVIRPSQVLVSTGAPN